MIPYFCSCKNTYLELVAKSLLSCLVAQPPNDKSFLGVRGRILILKGVPLLYLVADATLIPRLSLLVDPGLLLLPVLSPLLFDQIFIGNIEHTIYIFTCGGDGIKGPAFGLNWSSEKCDIIGFEELQHIRGHFGFHLVKLFVLG